MAEGNGGGRNILIGVAMIFLGLAAGPGYDFFCKQFSGSQVGIFDVFFHVSGRAAKPIGIDLDPAMNPVALNWSGDIPGGSSSDSYVYRASLLLAGRPVMQETFGVSRSKDRARKYLTIHVLTVTQPGHYDFVLEEQEGPPFRVDDMKVEVRRNVTVPSMRLLIGGWAVLAAGFLLVFAPMIVKATGPDSGPIWAASGGVVLVVGAVAAWLYMSQAKTPAAASAPPVARATPPKRPPAPAVAVAVSPAAVQVAASVAVMQASIVDVQPQDAKPGDVVTLRGTLFGQQEEHRVVVTGNGVEVPLEVVTWKKAEITARIPDDPRLQPGRYYYRVDRIKPFEPSKPLGFWLKR